MQTSFIPKKPIVETRISGGGISLFLLLAIIIFIVSLALAAGIWLWKGALVNQIEADKQALVEAKDSYEEDTINPLIRLDDRIEVSKVLLAKHLSISPIFTLLETNIIRNVQLKTMRFSYGGDDKIKIELTGTAVDYDALLTQSNIFGREDLRKFISQPVISDFNPTAEGNIAFNFSAFVDPRLVSYAGTLDSQETAVPSDSAVNNPE